jgi:hypothetical protein
LPVSSDGTEVAHGPAMYFFDLLVGRKTVESSDAPTLGRKM